ncbi:MAG: hypothetical protein ACRD6Q_02095 [Nitrososphaeraceae archaeon]
MRPTNLSIIFCVTRLLVNIIERQSHLEYTYHRIKWNDAKHTVRDGIVKKLSAAKQNLSIDKY